MVNKFHEFCRRRSASRPGRGREISANTDCRPLPGLEPSSRLFPTRAAHRRFGNANEKAPAVASALFVAGRGLLAAGNLHGTHNHLPPRLLRASCPVSVWMQAKRESWPVPAAAFRSGRNPMGLHCSLPGKASRDRKIPQVQPWHVFPVAANHPATPSAARAGRPAASRPRKAISAGPMVAPQCRPVARRGKHYGAAARKNRMP